MRHLSPTQPDLQITPIEKIRLPLRSREEGETIVLAESTGKEITVAKNNIAERRESEVSLMPENFGELMTQAEFNDLMAFLMSRTASAK